MKIDTITYLYHGTDCKFENLDLKYAKEFKDFGKGIYLTSDINQAQKWAQKKGEKKKLAYIYRYEYDKVDGNSLKILELLEYNKEWLDFICRNRISGEDSNYDIIYDRMADNRFPCISEILIDYMEKKITVDTATERLQFQNNKSDQYCFKTDKALERLCNRQIFTQYLVDGKWLTERE